MSNFDEWFNKHHAVKTAYSASYIIGAKKGFEAGAASRQAEIDALQKRIDEALQFAQDAHSDLNIGMLKMVQILKGESE